VGFSTVGNARDFMLLEYADLSEGETRAGQECPSCHGGRTNERTLSVSRRNGTVRWFCHRASCGFKGVSGGARARPGPDTQAASCRGVVGRQLVREGEQLPEWVLNYLSTTYYLDSAAVQRASLSWDSSQERLVLPVYNEDGENTGAVLRSLSGAVPKALTHAEDGAMAWYRNWQSDLLIIVEDQLSAIRASKYMNAVALLGTNLNEERAQVIARMKFFRVLIALDKDARAVMMGHVIRHRGYFRLQPILIEKDLKDSREQELKEILGVYDNAAQT